MTMHRRDFLTAITALPAAGAVRLSDERQMHQPAGARYWFHFDGVNWSAVAFDDIKADDTCLMVDVSDDGKLDVQLLHVKRRGPTMLHCDWCDHTVLMMAVHTMVNLRWPFGGSKETLACPTSPPPSAS